MPVETITKKQGQWSDSKELKKHVKWETEKSDEADLGIRVDKVIIAVCNLTLKRECKSIDQVCE